MKASVAFTLEKLLPVFVWVLAGVFVLNHLWAPLSDPDFWWHLADGRYMVQHRLILRSEVFSHTLAGTPWIDFEWLSQILLYLLVRSWGFGAAVLAKIFLGFAAVALLGLSLWRNGARGPLHFLLTWTGFHLLKPRLHERFELLTLIFLALLVLVLTDGRAQARPKQRLTFLAVLMLAWCNLHGGFLFGLAASALLILGAVWSKQERPSLIFLASSFAVLSLFCLLNPFGARLGTIVSEHAHLLGAPANYIGEWQPTSMLFAPLYWAVVFISGALAVVGVLKREGRVLFWIPAVLAFSIWGTRHYRNVAVAAMILIPFLAEALTLLRPKLSRLAARFQGAAWLACAALLVFELHAGGVSLPKEAVNWNVFPVRACAFLKDHAIKGRMYNEYAYGGFLEWTLGEDFPVFMDGRYPFYPLLEQEAAPLYEGLPYAVLRDRYAAHLKSHRVEYAVMGYSDFQVPSPDPSPFSLTPLNVMFPRSEWALVFWDDAALIFLKRSGANRALAERCEYKALRPHNPPQTLAELASGAVSADQVAQELERHQNEIGPSLRRNRLQAVLGGMLPERPLGLTIGRRGAILR